MEEYTQNKLEELLYKDYSTITMDFSRNLIYRATEFIYEILMYLALPRFKIIVILLTDSIFVMFEIFTVVTTRNSVFWDVTLCGCCNN
jgi:hypothetical protein